MLNHTMAYPIYNSFPSSAIAMQQVMLLPQQRCVLLCGFAFPSNNPQTS